MSKNKWTSSQLNAINARKGSILISAAAGSGKTAVLVERVMEILSDKNNLCNIDELLVVTFTKAAASEMKERINSKISEMLKIDPDNKILQRQQLLIPRANISTIHSFCNDFIKENFYELSISPEFRIFDEKEMLLLKNKALNTILEKKYKTKSKIFYSLVEIFSSNYDDKRLCEIILTLYNFIMSHPFPEKWLNEKLSLYDKNINIKNSNFGEILINYALDLINYCLTLANESINIIQEDDKIKATYEEILFKDINIIISIKNIFINNSWNDISKYLKSIKFAPLKRLTGYNDDFLKQKVSLNRQTIKDIIKKLTQFFYPTEEDYIDDIEKLYPLVKELFSIIKDFHIYLNDMKKEKNIVDFSDLEHLALKLLAIPTDNGFEKTEIAKNLSKKFKYIMVDEYQDTNEAQDLLFRALSNNENNLFVVGDVKQSIYSFRQAMPEIFLRRKEKYQLFDENIEKYPAKIILDKNFRSRLGVINATNFVFSQLMSKSAGDMDYTNEEYLKLGAEYKNKTNPDVHIKIIDISNINKDENMNIIEARYISSMIKNIINEGREIKDKNGYRKVNYGDFCVLLRSVNKHAEDFVTEFEKQGIPVWSDARKSFIDTLEISTMVSLFKIIDNPTLDAPLIAVMLSPIYNFSPDDLCEIRVVNKDVCFYSAIKMKINNNINNNKLKNFLDEINDFRKISACVPAHKAIQYIYEKTGYINIVRAMENGEARVNNLILLLECAKNYENTNNTSLLNFVDFINELQEIDCDIAFSSTVSESNNAVRIMSIHRSKGLEFPFCIIANCSRKFNKDTDEVLLHPNLGVGVKLLDSENMRKYSTIQRDAIKIDLNNKLISEELRVLYVAMTRAREDLIMITSLKNIESTLSKLANQITDDKVISPYVVKNSTCFSDWLLLCALRHPYGSMLRKTANASPNIVIHDNTKWNIEILDSNNNNNLFYNTDHDEIINFNDNSDFFDNVDIKDLKNEIEKRLNFHYKYESLNEIPEEISVTDLISNKENTFPDLMKMRKPKCLLNGEFSGSQKGTALHLFMQFARLNEAKINLDKEINYLLEKNFISSEQSLMLNKHNIQKFLDSDLCTRMINSNKLTREFNFMININIIDIFENIDINLKDEKILLRGTIDCMFEEDGKLIIVDYKTNEIKSSLYLKNKYEKQLKLYSRAVKEITGKDIKEEILYSFYTGEIIVL